jgi:hypothetical protein
MVFLNPFQRTKAHSPFSRNPPQYLLVFPEISMQYNYGRTQLSMFRHLSIERTRVYLMKKVKHDRSQRFLNDRRLIERAKKSHAIQHRQHRIRWHNSRLSMLIDLSRKTNSHASVIPTRDLRIIRVILTFSQQALYIIIRFVNASTNQFHYQSESQLLVLLMLIYSEYSPF